MLIGSDIRCSLATRLPVLLLSLAQAAVTAAADPAAGRQKSAACRVCHGIDGISVRPDAPHIAGQVEPYLRRQLWDYRSGKRQHPVMSVVAQGLSDADIDNLSAYYSSIRIVVESPPSPFYRWGARCQRKSMRLDRIIEA